jgi:hypothetical protein
MEVYKKQIHNPYYWINSDKEVERIVVYGDSLNTTTYNLYSLRFLKKVFPKLSNVSVPLFSFVLKKIGEKIFKRMVDNSTRFYFPFSVGYVSIKTRPRKYKYSYPIRKFVLNVKNRYLQFRPMFYFNELMRHSYVYLPYFTRAVQEVNVVNYKARIRDTWDDNRKDDFMGDFSMDCPESEIDFFINKSGFF